MYPEARFSQVVAADDYRIAWGKRPVHRVLTEALSLVLTSTAACARRKKR